MRHFLSTRRIAVLITLAALAASVGAVTAAQTPGTVPARQAYDSSSASDARTRMDIHEIPAG